MNSITSESLEAGIHRLANGTDTYICDCDACLRKNKGKPKRVPRTTYFRHKPNRLARLFPPPLPAQTPAPIPAPSSSKRPLDASDHPEQPPISKHKDDRIDGAEDDFDIPEAADNIPGPDALDGAFDHLEDTNFGDTGPEDREEEEEARVEDNIPENFDQDMPPDDVDLEGADTDLGTMGWTDEDLDELQQMACLEDAQDSMSFITALRKASLDDTHSKLPLTFICVFVRPCHGQRSINMVIYRPHFFSTSSRIFSSVVYATALFRPTWQTTMSTTPVNPLPTFALPPSHLLSSST